MQIELHEKSSKKYKEIGVFKKFFPDLNFKSSTQCKNKEDILV